MSQKWKLSYIHLIAITLAYKNEKREKKRPKRNKLGWLTAFKELL